MSIVVTTTAGASAAMAAQRRRMERERCELTLQTYQPEGATVTEMREYADCVNVLYPRQLEPGEIFMLKALLVVCAVAMVVGIFKGDDLEEKLLNAFIWPVVTGGVVFILSLALGLVLVAIGWSEWTS